MVYHHADHLSGASVETDSEGYVVEVIDYNPFGSSRLDETYTQDYENDKKFTGYELDDTGLHYANARYYNSEVGRFASLDPASLYNPSQFLTDPQQFNLYAYGRNNPLRYSDPEGESIWDMIAGATNAFASNFAMGAGRIDSRQYAGGSPSDYAIGQKAGDVAGVVFGALEIVIGGTLTGAGGATVVASPATGPAAVAVAPAGAAVAASGVALVGHGAAMGVTSASNLINTSGFGGNYKKWTPGDPINQNTRFGYPSWGTVRKRYWRNEAHNNPNNYSADDLARMKKGNAPLDSTGVPYELDHISGRNIPDPHNESNLRVMSKQAHTDRHKADGYKL